MATAKQRLRRLEKQLGAKDEWDDLTDEELDEAIRLVRSLLGLPPDAATHLEARIEPRVH